jgi:hypothetical protein
MKQETLEEAAERFYGEEEIVNDYDISGYLQSAFLTGAKWQQERSYSEKDMKSFGDWCRNGLLNTEYGVEKLDEHLEKWKQFKKK